MVRDILPQLRDGRVTRGKIGVSVLRAPLTKDIATSYGLPNTSGAIIGAVAEGGPADKAGVKVDDVITQFNGKQVKDNSQLVDMVMHTAPGTTVPVEIYRAKKPMTLSVRVDALDLAQEQELVADGGGNPSRPNAPRAPRNEPKDTAFGMQLREITPGIARDLGLTAGKGGARDQLRRSDRQRRARGLYDRRRDPRHRRHDRDEHRPGQLHARQGRKRTGGPRALPA